MYNVLLVDDEFMILTGLEKLIPWEHLNLTLIGTAKNGAQALEMVMNNKVDIVLTDITMPVLSGIYFLKQAVSRGLYFKTIFLSGYQEFEFVKEGMTLGAVNYLLKPVNEEELVETLVKCVESLKSDEEKILSRKQNEKKLFFEGVTEMMTTEFIANYQLQNVKGFGIFTLDNPSEELISLFKQMKQLLFYTQEQTLVGLFYHVTERELEMQYKELRAHFKKLDVFKGGYQQVIYDIPASYQVAKEKLEFARFYNYDSELLIRNETSKTESVNSLIEQVFLTEGFFIHDIAQQVAEIIAYFKEVCCPPIRVKQVTTLFIIDSQRYFDIWQEYLVQKELDKVAKISNVIELEVLYLNILTKIMQRQNEYAYSLLTKNTIGIIRLRYHEDLSLKEIAKELFVNSMYLGQVIKKETGKNFSQYLNDYRMKKAQELLIKTKQTINEISFEIGYSSAGYFHKMFKEFYGLTPKEFRNQYFNY